MSCVLRVSNSSVDSTSSNVSLKPFRAENTTEHFNVSDAEFDNFKAQIEDAIAFLDQYRADIQLLMAAPRASGVLDFAIESRDVPVQCDYFPAPLVPGLAGCQYSTVSSKSMCPAAIQTNTSARFQLFCSALK